MEQYTKQEINKIFDALPQELRHAVLSPETANAIQKIAKDNKIKNSDIPVFATLVGDILMGLLPPEKLVEALKKELKISEVKGEQVLQEVNKLILAPVKDKLSKLYNKKSGPTKDKGTTEEIRKTPPTIVENKEIQRNKRENDTYREAID